MAYGAQIVCCSTLCFVPSSEPHSESVPRISDSRVDGHSTSTTGPSPFKRENYPCSQFGSSLDAKAIVCSSKHVQAKGAAFNGLRTATARAKDPERQAHENCYRYRSSERSRTRSGGPNNEAQKRNRDRIEIDDRIRFRIG